MLGQVVFSFVDIVVSVNECATFDLGACTETVVYGSSEGVGHVRSILSGGSDRQSSPNTVGGGQGVVEVLDLESSLTDWVGGRADGGSGGSGSRSGRRVAGAA